MALKTKEKGVRDRSAVRPLSCTQADFRSQTEPQDIPPQNPGFCDECKGRVSRVRRARYARFCCSDCKRAWWRKAEKRGAQIYHTLTTWRRFRGRKGTPAEGLFAAICAMIDGWHRQDREADQ